MFSDELREVERRGNSITFDLTESQLLEAAECFQLLAPHGKSLREAVVKYVAELKVTAASIGLPALVEEVVRAKIVDGLSDNYIPTFRSRLRIFATAHQEVLASDITTPLLAKWLRDTLENPTTRNNYRRDLRTMFSFALAQGYVTSNPAVGVTKAKEGNSEVEALSVDEICRLLHAADRVILPIVAITASAGIRPEEVNRLVWQEVDFVHGEIEVKAEKSKTGARQIVKMSPNLLAWLPLSTSSDRRRDGLVRPRLDDRGRTVVTGQPTGHSGEGRRGDLACLCWSRP